MLEADRHRLSIEEKPSIKSRLGQQIDDVLCMRKASIVIALKKHHNLKELIRLDSEYKYPSTQWLAQAPPI